MTGSQCGVFTCNACTIGIGELGLLGDSCCRGLMCTRAVGAQQLGRQSSLRSCKDAFQAPNPPCARKNSFKNIAVALLVVIYATKRLLVLLNTCSN